MVRCPVSNWAHTSARDGHINHNFCVHTEHHIARHTQHHTADAAQCALYVYKYSYISIYTHTFYWSMCGACDSGLPPQQHIFVWASECAFIDQRTENEDEEDSAHRPVCLCAWNSRLRLRGVWGGRAQSTTIIAAWYVCIFVHTIHACTLNVLTLERAVRCPYLIRRHAPPSPTFYPQEAQLQSQPCRQAFGIQILKIASVCYGWYEKGRGVELRRQEQSKKMLQRLDDDVAPARTHKPDTHTHPTFNL